VESQRYRIDGAFRVAGGCPDTYVLDVYLARLVRTQFTIPATIVMNTTCASIPSRSLDGPSPPVGTLVLYDNRTPTAPGACLAPAHARLAAWRPPRSRSRSPGPPLPTSPPPPHHPSAAPPAGNFTVGAIATPTKLAAANIQLQAVKMKFPNVTKYCDNTTLSEVTLRMTVTFMYTAPPARRPPPAGARNRVVRQQSLPPPPPAPKVISVRQSTLLQAQAAASILSSSCLVQVVAVAGPLVERGVFFGGAALPECTPNITLPLVSYVDCNNLPPPPGERRRRIRGRPGLGPARGEQRACGAACPSRGRP
jgi:hypothetical protein